MNSKSSVRFLAACTFALAAPMASLAVPGIDFARAHGDFMKAGRNRDTPIGDVSNAFARVVAATNLTAEAHAKALVDFARFHEQRDLFEPSIACYEAAFGVEKAPPAIRVRALSEAGKALSRQNFKGAFASYYHKELDRAAILFLRIAEFPGATGMEKVMALQDAAAAMLDAKQEVDPAAEALLVKATKLPGLKQDEQIRARLNLARYYVCSLAPEKARPVFESLLPFARDQKVNGNLRSEILQGYADRVEKSDGFDKALDLITKGALKGDFLPLDVARFCADHGHPEKEYEYVLLGKPGADAKPEERSKYLRGPLWRATANRGLDAFRAFFEKDILPILKDDPAEWKRGVVGDGQLAFLQQQDREVASFR